jgi:tuftelin-interacting protein 11
VGDDGDKENDDDLDGKRGWNDTPNSSSESEGEGPLRASSKSQKRCVSNLDGEIAGPRKKRPVLNPALINKGMGSWEKHTRGIGAKLLLQMGFQPGKSG